jgi:hypothetical protein
MAKINSSRKSGLPEGEGVGGGGNRELPQRGKWGWGWGRERGEEDLPCQGGGSVGEGGEVHRKGRDDGMNEEI